MKTIPIEISPGHLEMLNGNEEYAQDLVSTALGHLGHVNDGDLVVLVWIPVIENVGSAFVLPEHATQDQKIQLEGLMYGLMAALQIRWLEQREVRAVA